MNNRRAFLGRENNRRRGGFNFNKSIYKDKTMNKSDVEFGAAEKQVARKILEECIAAHSLDKEEFNKNLKVIRNRYDQKEKEYYNNKTKAPEKYTYFFYNLYEVESGFFLIMLNIHHVYRRFPRSEDFSVMTTSWVVEVRIKDSGNLDYSRTRIYEEVSID